MYDFTNATINLMTGKMQGKDLTLPNWDMPSTKWPFVLLTDKSFTKIQWEFSSVMKTIEKHKKLVAEAPVVGKKLY